MLGSAPLSQSKDKIQAGHSGQKGLKVLYSPYHLQLADSCSHHPCAFLVCLFFHKLLTHRNSVDQTSRLEDINMSAYPKGFEVDRTAAGLLKLSCFSV